MDIENILTEYLESVLLQEGVREWLVIFNKGLLGNKRVVYSSEDKRKVEDKFRWYRDTYPDFRFKIMSKTTFRDIYHRFPEYLSQENQEKYFPKQEKEVYYGGGKHKTRKRYIYVPKHKEKVVYQQEPTHHQSIKPKKIIPRFNKFELDNKISNIEDKTTYVPKLPSNIVKTTD